MNKKLIILILPICMLLQVIFPSGASAGGARIEMFSPQGTIKGVRQVSARFSEQVVPFGDPRLVEPFEITCTEKGKARWADGKNWIYDFDRDLPAGVRCDFVLKEDLKTLSGKAPEGQRRFSFSTGGPEVIESHPYDGARNIAEDQIFVLVLDAEAKEASVVSKVSCSISGINERVGVRVIKGEEREKVLRSFYYRENKEMPRLVIQCRQNFPNKADVQLVMGKGIASISGVETAEDRTLSYSVREPFTARLSCERETPSADCIPLLPVSLNFSSPVSWDIAKNITLSGKGKNYKPQMKSAHGYYGDEEEETEGEDAMPPDNAYVNGVFFKGPFPENSSFAIGIPKDLRDDAGRALSNKDKFPLTVKTDSYPPLAKFAAPFGIIEHKGDAALPVTLRNLEPAVKTRILKAEEKKTGLVDKAKEGFMDGAAKLGEKAVSILPGRLNSATAGVVEGLKGRLHRLKMDKEEKVIYWMKKIHEARREETIFQSGQDIREFSVARPAGNKAFEVVGIPLKEAGFYVVEMESRILGDRLLGNKKPMYVPTAALVTDLSAHFKWGREASLVWVTALENAKPVKGAAVSVRDCNGQALWKGKTDENGIAKIRKKLPSIEKLPYCNGAARGLFVFARTANDMTFVHSDWDKGIEPFRYNLPEASYRGPEIAHTIIDRNLLRAGETAHMKHIIRSHGMSGFSVSKVSELPKTLRIVHKGSNQSYIFPLKWDQKGIAENAWQIPKDAKLGSYEIELLKESMDARAPDRTAGQSDEGEERFSGMEGWHSGELRVEEFRIPVMKGMIQSPKGPLVNASGAEVDLLVTHLSGGGASGLPVTLRGQIQPRYVHFDDYEDFIFANGEVREGTARRSSYQAQEDTEAKKTYPRIQTVQLQLDKAGSVRTKIPDLPKITEPKDMLTELEFRDPGGEVQTISAKIPLWPAGVLVGIRPESWAASKEAFKFHVAVLDLSGRPVAGRPVSVALFQRKIYSHRKRLVGGFYSYEHVTETKRAGQVCEGNTDARGLLICDVKSPVSGNVIVQASAADDLGNISTAQRDVWIAGKGQWWFNVTDNDRIDLIPEKKRYEPGDIAKLQVRMPFRSATALVTIEREGVMESFVRRLSGDNPVIEVPLKKNYAPNIFVSCLVVRGRVSGVQATALVDLGKPAYKLGISEINVGWRGHELKVKVSPERQIYRIREKARVNISVVRADGSPPPKGSEVAIAAVDEGLLELLPNRSWNLLEAMMGRRGYEVMTSTAQTQVVGKRHYGLKALPQGGGGGRQITRELFDTLLLWKARVPLNAKGEASVEIPLNDSLTGFRIVAVANGGKELFGTGHAGIRTTQDLMILSGVPQLVRGGDSFRAGFTVRNASSRKMDLEITAKMKAADERELDPLEESLSPGEAKEIGWDIKAPNRIETIGYEVSVREKAGEAKDSIKVSQKVSEAVAVRTFEATITQVEDGFDMDVEKPRDALSGKGGIGISLSPRLSGGLSGVTRVMKRYPYSCMEQKISKAVSLRDITLWENVMSELPAHLDSEGLLKYFPTLMRGDDTLTAYVLAISDEAGWEIPAHLKVRMEEGLNGFIEGRVIRYSSLPTADLSIRKMAAIEALSRGGKGDPKLLDSIALEPELWPTSAVLDWINVLLRVKDIADHEKRLVQAEQILRSRMNFQGSTMGFSTERTDNLWWLMISTDVNAVRSVLTFLNFDSWKQDMPRLARGALGRQHKGAWLLTTANAWGVLAIEKFSKKFESIPVSGTTSASLGGKVKAVEWDKSHEGKAIMLGWPKEREALKIRHQGTGKPWAMVQSLAAIPLMEPLSSGFRIIKTATPIDQKSAGRWSRGDVVRIRLEIEAQADMTWVAVNDPIPGGTAILGTGMGRDSQILTKGELKKGWVFPAFEERSFEAFRAYYEFVPKGKWMVEYTLRLNNGGEFSLPPTRVEALYAPEMFGELPNGKWMIEQ